MFDEVYEFRSVAFGHQLKQHVDELGPGFDRDLDAFPFEGADRAPSEVRIVAHRLSREHFALGDKIGTGEVPVVESAAQKRVGTLLHSCPVPFVLRLYIVIEMITGFSEAFLTVTLGNEIGVGVRGVVTSDSEVSNAVHPCLMNLLKVLSEVFFPLRIERLRHNVFDTDIAVLERGCDVLRIVGISVFENIER